MITASMLVAAALVVSTMPAPEHDDCEVVTNCVFDASRQDGLGNSVERNTNSVIRLNGKAQSSGELRLR